MRIPRWKKISMILIASLTLFMLLFDITFYRAFFYNPQNLTVTYKTITDPRIPSSLDQVSVLYIGDLQYDASFGKEKGDRLFEKIRDLNPDVLLFGGDLFAWNADLSDEVRAMMQDWIHSVPAPLGKFAVYGEQDLADENHRLIVDDVYYQSQVELINNTSVLIANGTVEGIRLGGINVEANFDALNPAFLPEQFGMIISHYPDNLIAAVQAGLNADYALAGNSHGTQITWPLFGGYKQYAGSININRTQLTPLAFPYYVSSGIGCLNVQARLNAPVELVYLTLSNRA